MSEKEVTLEQLQAKHADVACDIDSVGIIEENDITLHDLEERNYDCKYFEELKVEEAPTDSKPPGKYGRIRRHGREITISITVGIFLYYVLPYLP